MLSATSAAIRVAKLRKFYEVPEREAGLGVAIKSLVKRRTRQVKAVDGVTFEVAPGEVVGFLGPNGAGKTTTLKMLSGLLYPTSGELSVLGHLPEKREREFLRRITLVMGNRNQLVWDIPALDSFELNRSIYGLPEAEFKHTRDEFIELLELGPLTRKPVRNLSLGERMKMEVAGALLHRPQVLFLDEPTIGLDATMQKRIRHFIAEYNRRTGATVLLTSHYMADVEALCKRVIVSITARFCSTASGVIQMMIQPNMARLMEEIQEGTLDYALTKPADAQVLVSVREIRIWQMVDVLMGLIVLGVAIYRLQVGVGVWQALAFAVALLLGATMIYCFWMILTTGAFWVVRMHHLVELFQGIYQAGRWPVEVYPEWLRAGLTFLVPVAFAVTVPAEALTQRLTLQTLLGAFAFTIALVVVARLWWRVGLRRYSGASA